MYADATSATATRFVAIKMVAAYHAIKLFYVAVHASSSLVKRRNLESNLNDPVALYVAAAKLASSNSGIKSEQMARDLYLRAAESGHVEALWCAGTMLLNGEGGKQDIPAGLALAEISATLSSYDASMFLSDVYRNGLFGQKQDLGRAEAFRRLACEQGQLEIECRIVAPTPNVLGAIQRARGAN